MESLTPAAIGAGLHTERFGRWVHYFERTGSTNDVARSLAVEGAPEGTLVIAEEQAAGRGRLGRSWLAPARSCLLMSLILRPSVPATQGFRATMLCAVAAAMAVERVCEVRPAVKWPNDLLLGGKKLAGVLSEASAVESRLDWVVVGVGLNVNFDPALYPEIAATATSLQAELGREVSRLGLLRTFLEELEAGYRYLAPAAGGHDRLWEEWKGRLDTLGRQVTVTEGDRRVSGLAEDVLPDGSLVLRRDDGSTLAIAVGDVTLRG